MEKPLELVFIQFVNYEPWWGRKHGRMFHLVGGTGECVAGHGHWKEVLESFVKNKAAITDTQIREYRIWVNIWEMWSGQREQKFHLPQMVLSVVKENQIVLRVYSSQKWRLVCLNSSALFMGKSSHLSVGSASVLELTENMVKTGNIFQTLPLISGILWDFKFCP